MKIKSTTYIGTILGKHVTVGSRCMYDQTVPMEFRMNGVETYL